MPRASTGTGVLSVGSISITGGTVGVTQVTSPWVVSLPSTTITGSVAVTGTFWQATQPVSIAGTVTVDASGFTVPVSNAGLTELAAAINASSQMDSLEATPTTVGSFQTTVTTAATRVQLATNTALSVTVKAKSTNTGLIYVGDSTVAAANGFILSAGESVSYALSNTNKLYVDSSVNGEGVSTTFVST